MEKGGMDIREQWAISATCMMEQNEASHLWPEPFRLPVGSRAAVNANSSPKTRRRKQLV